MEFAQTYQHEMEEEIKRLNPKHPILKSALPDFDALVFLTDAQISLLLSKVETRDLAIALRGASDRVSSFLLGKLPENEQEILQSAISALCFLRLKDVEATQEKILVKVRDEVAHA